MSIPTNITKDHLLKAIQKIDLEGVPLNGDSQYYDVIYNGKEYPPKLIVSYANIFANGSELGRNSFGGGQETQCFKLLEENGFFIKKKSISYYLLGAAWSGHDNPDQSERFIENDIWENGYDDKFLDIVKNVQVEDRVAIKSSFATREGKSNLRIKATGTVYENPGDGRTIRVKWDNRFSPFDLEGYGSYRNTIQKVNDEDIEAIFKNQTNMSYYAELIKFLKQAKTSELGTTNYSKSFQGLVVKVSFGKGNQARIPWIAFLRGNQTVQNGIYPVYLFFKDKNLLVLAYGISETNTPQANWNLSNPKTIVQFFSQNHLGYPDRYGNSFVFKSYDTSKELAQKEIDDDLNELTTLYKEIDLDYDIVDIAPIKSSLKILKETILTSNENFEYLNFYHDSIKSSFFITQKLCLRFVASLLTKPFVILTGLSGSGKTKLAQAFATWICEDHSQYCIVPVGADWTNREPLLGFSNALELGNYVKPDNGILDLIIDANKNKSKPFFLILDEMNLSHVERYFADFLSVMESKHRLQLHAGPDNWNGVPSEVSIPENIFVIGTVNIDETTYMFSPKVLDRASVIEFRVNEKEMEGYLTNNKILNLDLLKTTGASMAKAFIDISNDKTIEPIEIRDLNKELLSFFKELKKAGSEFGYRSATEIFRLVGVINKVDPTLSTTEIIDIAIMQKLLPKVHGSRRKLEPVLKVLGSLCLNEEQDINNFLIPENEVDFYDTTRIKYPISLEKIHRMYQSLVSNGFVSYAEA